MQKTETLGLTQQREGDSEDEDHDPAAQGQHDVAGDHDSDHEQAGVLPFEVLDGGLVLSRPDRSREDEGHHGSSQKQAERVEEPARLDSGTQ